MPMNLAALAYRRCVRSIGCRRNFSSSPAASIKVPEYEGPKISCEPAMFIVLGLLRYLSEGIEKKTREEEDLYLASKRQRQELRELRVQLRRRSLPKSEE